MILKPAIPFVEIPSTTGPNSALEVVRSLDEEQVRYALWATLVSLFGSLSCNAPEKIAGDLPVGGAGVEFNAFKEAHYILAQIGIGRRNPGIVESIRRKQGL